MCNYRNQHLSLHGRYLGVCPLRQQSGHGLEEEQPAPESPASLSSEHRSRGKAAGCRQMCSCSAGKQQQRRTHLHRRCRTPVADAPERSCTPPSALLSATGPAAQACKRCRGRKAAFLQTRTRLLLFCPAGARLLRRCVVVRIQRQTAAAPSALVHVSLNGLHTRLPLQL